MEDKYLRKNGKIYFQKARFDRQCFEYVMALLKY